MTNSDAETELISTQFDIPLDRICKTRNSVTKIYQNDSTNIS